MEKRKKDACSKEKLCQYEAASRVITIKVKKSVKKALELAQTMNRKIQTHWAMVGFFIRSGPNPNPNP
jgi:hypothetical protein